MKLVKDENKQTLENQVTDKHSRNTFKVINMIQKEF